MSRPPALSPCPDEALLRRHLFEDDAPLVATVEAHIETCPLCQERLDGLLAVAPDPIAALFAVPSPSQPVAETQESPPYLPGYQVVGYLAEGGMGVVWRVRDRQFGRDLAIKVLKARLAEQPHFVRRFTTEARICARLAHPFIVPVHTMGHLADGRPYYTMKLVVGDTLAQRLHGRTSPGAGRLDFLRIFAQVCQAVAHAHAQGVIHRDLKPGNVMVGADGEVQVMDWGVAKELPAPADPAATVVEGPTATADTVLEGEPAAERTRAGSILGTRLYMPPEQARGEIHRVDRRADVFALGAILCEILTGAPPYAGSAEEVVRRATEGDLSGVGERLRATGADPALIALAERCLAVEPDGRPADAGAVADAMARYLAEAEERLQQERVERQTHELRLAEERRRRRLWLGLAAALLVAASLTALGLFAWHSYEAERRGDQQWAEGEMQVAVDHLRANRLDEARAALTRAEAGMPNSVPAAVCARLDRLLAAQKFADDLRAIQEQRTVAASYGRSENDQAMNAYETRFAAEGLDPEGDLDPLAATLRQSPVVVPILAALDNWALVCSFRMGFYPDATEEHRAGRLRRDRLLALARLVDSEDPLRRDLRDPRAWDSRAELERLARAAEATIQDPEQRHRLSPNLIALFAHALREEARVDAENLLRVAQAAHEGDFWLNYQLGALLNLLYEADRAAYQKAEPESLYYLHGALALRPGNSAVLNALGGVYNEHGRGDRSIHYHRRAVEADPTNANAWNGLGVAYRDHGNGGKGDPVQAEQCFRKAAALNERHALPRMNLGSLLVDQGRLAEGLRASQDAWERDRTAADVNHRHAHNLHDAGLFGAAERHYEIALTNHLPGRWPPVSWIHNNRGYNYHVQGKFDLAEREYRKVIALEPPHALAQTNLSATLLEAGGNLGLAIALNLNALDAIAQRTPTKATQAEEYQRLLTETNLRQAGRLVWFVAALRLHDQGAYEPASADDYLGLAQACRYQGRHAEAVAFYTEAFRLDPKRHEIRNRKLSDARSLGDDENVGHRFFAIRSAVLAGQGDQARTWLRAELAFQQARATTAQARKEAVWILRRYEGHVDLAGVRGEALARLPAAERAAWQAWWEEVQELIGELEKPLDQVRADDQRSQSATLGAK